MQFWQTGQTMLNTIKQNHSFLKIIFKIICQKQEKIKFLLTRNSFIWFIFLRFIELREKKKKKNLYPFLQTKQFGVPPWSQAGFIAFSRKRVVNIIYFF